MIPDRFRQLSEQDQAKELAEIESEIKRLYNQAIGNGSQTQETPNPALVGTQVLNQLGSLFTQFLAWQRLMQLIDVVPEKDLERVRFYLQPLF